MSATRCFNSSGRAARNRGFTVLEMMVVLIIVGMIAVSLFQGLERLNDVRGRLSPFLSASDREGLVNSYFRNAVNQIVADKLLAKNVFVGGPTGFSGLTLTPLAGDPGGPSVFRWDLVYDAAQDRTTLRYTGFDQKPLELRGWHGNKVNFAYLGPDLAWRDAWPPPLGKFKQLPLAIRLYAVDDGIAIAAAIRGEKEPPPDPLALFMGQ
ncbi:MAG: ral secretion pathway protein [Aliidongia sp.]|nr:ral secretion pathway protein [Aliidongia sp.]